jgi:Flp pilus assembly protein TadB
LNRLDPEGAAYFALIAIGLVLLGAVIATSALSAEQRATVVAGVVGTLLLVAYRWRTRRRRDEYTPRESNPSEDDDE